MKTTSLFFAIASVASVFAAAVPGATDMSSTATSNTSRQANSASEQNPAANYRAATPDVIQGTSPVVKQETSPRQQQQQEEETDIPGFIPFYVQSPKDGVTYVTGQTAKIAWINGYDGPFLIRVITGEDVNSMQSTNVTLRGEGSKGYYDWTVPGYLHDGNYAFEFSFKVKGKSQETYSPPFIIATSKTF